MIQLVQLVYIDIVKIAQFFIVTELVSTLVTDGFRSPNEFNRTIV
jgi:hypothetical protein